ncbi:hypothetical protein IEQ34_011717 [Dendrobium chrysotoxum]|uniref:Uncharacterized protein n=1 Tax=Dendrobium chrysotoxum TaxID=161865 RepID=A0AAV7GSZ6_DENCH|nr:hypothetical protein IEQ34_011717 [Dendrobium chrysotoxum]
MAGEEVAKQSSERRRSRAGLNLHVNFNGGVVLLLGAAAGALLASAFAAHRVRAHKRRRGSMKEGIQGDSGEHLAALEAKEFVGDEGGVGDGANAGEGVFQVNSHDNLDASVQISQVDQREIGFYLLEEGKGEFEERSSTIDIELVDGERGELAGLRESSADVIMSCFFYFYLLYLALSYLERLVSYFSQISSSPANTCHNLGEKQLRYDEAASVKEECKASCVNCKEDDEEDNEKAYIEEWDQREEIDENMNSSDLRSEQPRLLEKKISQNLEMVIAIEERNFEDGFKDEMYNSILEFVVSRAKELATSPPGDQDEMNPLIEEGEPFFEESGEAKKALDITQNDSGKHPEMVIMEDGIRKESGGFKDDEGLDILRVQQDIEERDASDGKMVEGSRDLSEQTVALSHESSFTAITEPETSSCNDLVMVKAKEDFQLIAHINGIMHIEEDKKGVEVNNYPSAVEGIEGLIDEIQGTEFLLHSYIRDNPTMIVAVEEKTQLEDNTICDLDDVIQEEKTEDNLLNGLKENVESETEEDFQLISHINGITHIEEEKMGVEESNYPYADEGVDGLMDEIQGKTQPPLGSSLKKEASLTEFFLLQSCTHENPAMIIAVEEKTQLEENTTWDLNDVIQEEKTEENLLNGVKENVESSEAEENLRENEECPLAESQRIEFSLEHDNLMACKEKPLIQFQGIEPIVREEKACLDDRFPLSIESNMKIVQPIQDNNLDNSEKTLEIEECHMEAGAEDSETSPDEVEEGEDDAVSVQYHELETMQHIEAHKDKLEREIECPQTLPVVKKEEAEIHKESGAQIKEEEQILKLSFDLVEKGVKIVTQTVKQDTKTGLIDVDEKHQRKVDGDENTVSSKGKQQRIATKRVKRAEYMFIGYPRGYILLLTTLATAFAVLAFLYTKDFITRTAILENFIRS